MMPMSAMGGGGRMQGGGMGMGMPPQGRAPTVDPTVRQVLLERANSLTEADIDAFDAIITPQTYPTLVKMFPELIDLFEHASMFDDAPAPGSSALGTIGGFPR